MDSINQYFITTFNNAHSFLIDTTFDIQNSFQNSFHFAGDIDHNASSFYFFRACDEIDGDIFCIANTFDSQEYNMSLAKIITQENTFVFDTIYPLLPVASTEEITTSLSLKDSNNDFIAVGIGNSNPYNNIVEANKLYITKTDKFGNVYWSTIFENDTEMLVRDIVIDKNNDIILIGDHWSNDFLGERQNFFLKIYADGELSNLPSIQDDQFSFDIIPNPTTKSIRLNIPKDFHTTNSFGILTNSYGKQLMRLNNSALTQIIDLEFLPSGMYYLTIYIDGMDLNTKKIIKL